MKDTVSVLIFGFRSGGGAFTFIFLWLDAWGQWKPLQSAGQLAKIDWRTPETRVNLVFGSGGISRTAHVPPSPNTTFVRVFFWKNLWVSMRTYLLF